MHMIPKRAFADAAQMDAFRQMCASLVHSKSTGFSVIPLETPAEQTAESQ
jgi:hypothetical protein